MLRICVLTPMLMTFDTYCPPKLLKKILCKNVNNSIKSSLFPSCLKTADITPIYKTGKKDFKGNYRPVSILPVLSKSYKKSSVAVT